MPDTGLLGRQRRLRRRRHFHLRGPRLLLRSPPSLLDEAGRPADGDGDGGRLCSFFPSFLGHLQRADTSRPRVSEMIRPDRCVACALPTSQRCDAFRPMRPVRPIPGPNLRQVCIDADADGRRACPPAYHGSAWQRPICDLTLLAGWCLHWARR
jgi:hypothetical protein